MRRRLTVRVLLIDAAGRVLLMKGRLPSDPTAAGAWFTVGGAVEAGETILEAAAREIAEETGLAGVELGPVVWRREGALPMAGGEPVLFDEHYVWARCVGGEPSRAGWNAVETALVLDIRWWTTADLRASGAPVHPHALADLLDQLAAEGPPPAPLTIPWP